MFIVILTNSRPKSNVCQSYEEHNVNSTVILQLQFHTFHYFNIFKYLNTWHCTSQTDEMVLVFLCI